MPKKRLVRGRGLELEEGKQKVAGGISGINFWEGGGGGPTMHQWDEEFLEGS